jgi:hypothetical protein
VYVIARARSNAHHPSRATTDHPHRPTPRRRPSSSSSSSSCEGEYSHSQRLRTPMCTMSRITYIHHTPPLVCVLRPQKAKNINIARSRTHYARARSSREISHACRPPRGGGLEPGDVGCARDWYCMRIRSTVHVIGTACAYEAPWTHASRRRGVAIDSRVRSTREFDRSTREFDREFHRSIDARARPHAGRRRGGARHIPHASNQTCLPSPKPPRKSPRPSPCPPARSPTPSP